MSTDWLKQEHLEFMQELIPHLEHRSDKRTATELLYGLTNQLTAQLSEHAAEAMMAERESPLVAEDLEELQALVAMGVQHNGLAPQFSAVQVGRALRVLSDLTARAAIGALDLEDQEGLAWVFDVAAVADEGVNRDNVRRLENLVRGGLGLELRLHNYIPVNEANPA